MLALWLGPAYRSGMGIASEFAQHVEQLISVRLSAEGFRKSSKGGIFVKDVAPEVLCWVGLNKAGVKETGFEVNLVVGVRHQEVERQLAALLDEPWDPVIPPTLATNVGYLSPSGRYLGHVSPDPKTCPLPLDSFARWSWNSGCLSPVSCRSFRNWLRPCRRDDARFRSSPTTACPSATSWMVRPCGRRNASGQSWEKVGDAADPAAARYRHFASKLLDRIADTGEMAKGD